MAVGASHKFTMIIFTQKCGRCEPSWGKDTKAVFRRLLRVKKVRINVGHAFANEKCMCQFVQDVMGEDRNAHRFCCPNLGTAVKIPDIHLNTLPEFENNKVNTLPDILFV